MSKVPDESGGLAPAITPSINRTNGRSGRASGHRRYRTSDGQTILGYTSVIVGALSLGAVLLGSLRGSEIVPLFLVASFGLLAAAGWCAIDRKFQNATIFGALAGFNLSYALLQLGISNNWYSIPIADLTNVLSFYSLTWITIFLLLSFVAFNASVAAFGMFICFSTALSLVVAANVMGSITLLRWGAVPIGIVLLICVGLFGQVMWGWHRRNLIEAARALAGENAPAGEGTTTGPVSNRRAMGSS
jgi:hypothetical protein